MHCRCIDNNCHTVKDAVSVIERYEAILCNTQSTPVRALDVYDASQYESQILTAVQRLEARIEHIEKVCSHCPLDQRSMPSRSQRGCFGCNSPSHLWRNCPKNVNNTFAANDQRNFVRPSSKPGRDDRANNDFHSPNPRPLPLVPDVPPRSNPRQSNSEN
ncbi:hypothetical protein DPMN_179735 [Dreissena polymorpha]|uniref:CCHC-type domain-containing protein n=1 Tax=Dreissena polymorpha TaxID=45954 RepID=A0A9D4IL15_DREPO|nr:hypothetical protein DPMN_179735 [Dreissena polymorpha]